MPGPPLSVKPATEEDAGALSGIGRDSFLAAYGGTADPVAIDEHVDRMFGTDGILREMARAECEFQLATVGDMPAGLLKLRTGNNPDELGERHLLELQLVYVHSEFQGFGVGRALIDAAIRQGRSRSFEALWLQVWSEADWAIRFYRRNGFAKVGHMPYELGDSVFDDWVMLREL